MPASDQGLHGLLLTPWQLVDLSKARKSHCIELGTFLVSREGLFHLVPWHMRVGFPCTSAALPLLFNHFYAMKCVHKAISHSSLSTLYKEYYM